jgi:hypothetical protein
VSLSLEEWDAAFWAGKNDLCLSCMPVHQVRELRRQDDEAKRLAATGHAVGPRGWTGRTYCAKCGEPRPGKWPAEGA